MQERMQEGMCMQERIACRGLVLLHAALVLLHDKFVLLDDA